MVHAVVIAFEIVVTETDGPGLFTSADGTLSCSGCQLSDNAFAGAMVWGGGILDHSDTTIEGPVPDDNEGGGVGIYGPDRWGPNTLLIDETIIENHPLAAVWLDGDGSYSIRNSTLVGGYGETMTFRDGTTGVLHGDAVVALNGVQGLVLENDVIQTAPRAGLLLDESTAYMSGSTFSDNATDLVWQDCDGVEEPTDLDEVPVYEDRCDISTLPIAPLDFNLYLEEPGTTE